MKSNWKLNLKLWVLALGAAFVLGACKPSGLRITHEGATTTLAALTEAASAFEVERPGIRIEIAGGGSTHGFAAVVANKADFGTMARDLKKDEAAQVFHVPLAKDGLAVVVNEAVDLSETSLDRLQALYSQSEQPDGLLRVAKSWSHGTAQAFASGLGLSAADVQFETLAGSNGEVLAAVAANPHAIGYVSVSDANAAIAAGAPIRVLPINGVMPLRADIASGRYPLVRTLWIILPLPKPGQTAPAATEFVKFLLGPEGSEILSRNDFVPLN